MENKISNKTINSPQYSDSGVNGLVKISQTIGGHIDELDDTLGRERRVRCHPNGTREVWTNDRCDLVIYGDNYKIVVGDDNVTISGSVNLTINGDCNTTVAGDYNLTICKDMNVSVKGNIVQKCDGAYVVETTNGDIIHNSGSQYQQHSVGDMLTRCGGDYDCRSVEDINFNAVTSTFLGKNFVCASSDNTSITSGVSTTISSAGVNIVGTTTINTASPVTNIDSIVNITGTTRGLDFISSNRSISLDAHTHTSNSQGSPTSAPL